MAERRGRRSWRTAGLTLAAMALFAVLHTTTEFTWLRRAETLTFDLRLRLRGARPPGPDITIVLIDEAAIREAGRWPLPRRQFADLVGRLRSAGAKVIAFDILFAEADSGLPPAAVAVLAEAAASLEQRGRADLAARLYRESEAGDAAFARAIAEAGSVALPFAFRFDTQPAAPDEPLVARAAYRSVRAGAVPAAVPFHPTGVLGPVPSLAAAAEGLGHTLVALDADGAPRYEHAVIEYDLDYLPSLAVRIVQLYLGVAWDDVAVDLGSGIAVGPLFVPTDAAMRMIVNYRGLPRSFPTYSLADILAGKVPDERLRDRVVLVGAGLIGIGDRFATPFTRVLPGVERLASSVDTMLRSDHLSRPASAPPIEALCLMLAAALIGLAVAWLPIAAAACIALLLLALWIGAVQATLALFGVWLAAALPAAAVLATFTVAVAYQHGLLGREHRRVREAFAHYLAPDMVEALARRPEALRLGGDLREITVLFCDLRGFTGIAERLAPETLTRLVNRFLTTTADVVHAHGGTISKYTGDGLMAFWNAPLDQPDHAEFACSAALAMHEAVARLSDHLRADGTLAEPLAIGVGINTGPSVVGNFGSATRFDYSAHGDAVNVAARLETETKTYGVPILVGAETAARVPMLATLPVDRITLRGREQPVDLHVLLSDAAPAFAALRAAHLAVFDAFAAADWPRAERLLAELDGGITAELDVLYRRYRDLLRARRGAAFGERSRA